MWSLSVSVYVTHLPVASERGNQENGGRKRSHISALLQFAPVQEGQALSLHEFPASPFLSSSLAADHSSSSSYHKIPIHCQMANLGHQAPHLPGSPVHLGEGRYSRRVTTVVTSSMTKGKVLQCTADWTQPLKPPASMNCLAFTSGAWAHPEESPGTHSM